MKNLIFITIFLSCNLAFGQKATYTTSEIKAKSITLNPFEVTGEKQIKGVKVADIVSIAKDGTMPKVESIIDLQNSPYTIVSFDGSVWERKAGNINSNGGTSAGTIIKVNNFFYWHRKFNGDVNIKWFGAKGDGINDDTVPIQNALNATKDEPLTFPTGNYIVSSILTFSGSNLFIKGNGSTITHTSSDTTTISINGGFSQFTPSTSIARNATSISLESVTGLSKGDILYLNPVSTDSLWSRDRTDYIKGEFIEISNVDTVSLTITIKSPIIDSYNSGVILRRLNNKNIKIEGITFKRSNNLRCITVGNMSNVIISNCSISGANERSIYVYNSYNVLVNNCVVDGNYYSGAGTAYGLFIGSCQNVNVIGGSYRAGRHAICFGGSFPSRFISVSGCVVDNDPLQAVPVAAFDFHSNVQYAVLSNVISKNGYSLAGINISVSNCISIARNYYGFAFFSSRNAENTLNINGLQITSNSAYTPFIFTSVGNGTSYRFNVGNVQVSNISVTANMYAPNPALVSFAGTSTNQISYKYLGITGISVYSSVEQNTGTYGLGIALNSSAINADALVNISNCYIDSKCRAYITGFGNIATNISISDSYFKSYFTGSIFYCAKLGLGNYKISDTIFDGANNAYVDGTGGHYEFTNCAFNNMLTRCFMATDASYVSISNSTKSNSVPMYTAIGTSPELIDYIVSSTNAKVRFSNAAPVSGTWAVGDIVYNSVPAAAGNIGWVCVTAGTPGTWKSFGVISN